MYFMSDDALKIIGSNSKPLKSRYIKLSCSNNCKNRNEWLQVELFFTYDSFTPLSNATQNGFDASITVASCFSPRSKLLIVTLPPASSHHSLI